MQWSRICLPMQEMQKTQVQSLGWEDPPRRRKWQPTSEFLPGEARGQRSLVGHSPRGRKELDTTEWVSAHACQLKHFKIHHPALKGGSRRKTLKPNHGKIIKKKKLERSNDLKPLFKNHQVMKRSFNHQIDTYWNLASSLLSYKSCIVTRLGTTLYRSFFFFNPTKTTSP